MVVKMLTAQAPVMILRPNTKREVGRKAQLANIQAGKAVADIVRSTFGPKSMLKMLLDPMGGIVMTNDGNAILREIEVAHPAAKSVIELSRSQDEEVGDGTTSVVILAGEMLSVAEQFLRKKMHPTVIVDGYMKALDDILSIINTIAIPINTNDEASVIQMIDSCLGTKFSSYWSKMISKLALKAVQQICVKMPNGRKIIDIKKYCKVEKMPGGEIDESCVLDGIMINKDVTHSRMSRYIENPKVVLFDCPLEYRKGESQTNVEITKEEDWSKLLQEEEAEVQRMCEDIIQSGCNVVLTEKGVSDLAQHFLMKQGISVIRRVRKTDNNRIARATGAKIVNRTDELTTEDVGRKCGLFEIRKIGDEYYCFFIKCQDPKACTVLLRGVSKDVLNEVERNFQDAVNVARNIMLEPKYLPGGGATEMEVSARLISKAKSIEGVIQWPYKAVAKALEIIPITLAQNCGAKVVNILAELRAKHAIEGANKNIGFDGISGTVTDVVKNGLCDIFSVKAQAFKTAIEASAMLLRIDDVVSVISGKRNKAPMTQQEPEAGDGPNFGETYE